MSDVAILYRSRTVTRDLIRFSQIPPMSEAPEIVHVEYKSTDAVPARLEGYTRFVCLSDSHG